MSYPDLRPSITGHWPPLLTDIPVGVPMLGEHVGLHRGTIVGWTDRPEASWRPEELLWTPPGVKALDVAGEIVDVKTFDNLPGTTWVTSQLTRRDRYLETIRQRVQAGHNRLTAALAKMLGLPFDEALLSDRSAGDDGERVMRELRTQLERVA